MVFGVTDHREELCHKVKARAVLRQEEEEEVEEGLMLETPLLMSEGESLLLQEEGISFTGGSKSVLCQGAGEAEEVWEAVKCLVGKHAVPRRAEVSHARMRMYFFEYVQVRGTTRRKGGRWLLTIAEQGEDLLSTPSTSPSSMESTSTSVQAQRLPAYLSETVVPPSMSPSEVLLQKCPSIKPLRPAPPPKEQVSPTMT